MLSKIEIGKAFWKKLNLEEKNLKKFTQTRKIKLKSETLNLRESFSLNQENFRAKARKIN